MKNSIHRDLAVRASIYTIVTSLPILLAYILVCVLVEHLTYLSSTIRLIILISWILLIISILSLICLLFFSKKFLHIYIKKIKHNFIFVNSKDFFSFFNLVQLSKMPSKFARLAFNQLTLKFKRDIKFIEIKNFIRLKNVKYFTISFVILLVIFIFSFSSFKEPYKRIVNYQTAFSKPDLLQYTITPDNLICNENDDFVINLKITGNFIPDKIQIIKGIYTDYFIKTSEKEFYYKIHDVHKEISFEIVCKTLNHHKKYLLKVRPKSFFKDLEILVIPPAYLGLSNDTIYDLRELFIPEGSLIHLNLNFNKGDSIFISNELTNYRETFKLDKDYFTKSFYVFDNTNINFKLFCDRIISDSLSIHINAVKDRPPLIYSELLSNAEYIANFILNINDDYKINKIGYEFIKINYGNLKIIKNFNLFTNWNSSNFSNNIEVNYNEFSEIDSLGIRFFADDYYPYKTNHKAYSPIIILRHKESLSSIISEINNSQENINQIDNSLKNFENLRSKINSINNINQLDNFQKKQLIDEIQSTYDHFRKNSDHFMNQNNLNTDEKTDLKNFLNIIDSIYNNLKNNLDLNNINNLDLNKQINDLKQLVDIMNNKFKNSLDRNIFENIFDRLNELINNQIRNNNNLIYKTDSWKNSDTAYDSKLKEELNQLIKKHEDIKNEYDKAVKENFINNNLKFQNDSILKSISNEYEFLKQNSSLIDKGLKRINESYNEFQNNLQNEGMVNEDKLIDENALKSLLKSLIYFSKQIEYSSTNSSYYRALPNDSVFTNFIHFSYNWSSINDSLNRFLKQADIPVSSIANSSLKINKAIKDANKAINENNYLNFSKETNVIMSEINLINLSLSELLKRIEENNKNNTMEMAGMCSKPMKKGGNKQQSTNSLSEIIKIQQQLTEKMGQKQMKGENNSGFGNKEINEYINLQYEIRKKLSELLQNDDMQKYSKILESINHDMRESERKLLNKNSNPTEALRRQKNIETRLLEAEKAIREQEFENKRVSKDAGNYIRKWDEVAENEYILKKEKSLDNLKLNEVPLRIFYQNAFLNYQNSSKNVNFTDKSR